MFYKLIRTRGISGHIAGFRHLPPHPGRCQAPARPALDSSSSTSPLLHLVSLFCTSRNPPHSFTRSVPLGSSLLIQTAPYEATSALNLRPNACAPTLLDIHDVFDVHRKVHLLLYISLLISHVAALYIFAGGYCKAAFPVAHILYWASGEQGRASARVPSLSSSFTSPICTFPAPHLPEAIGTSRICASSSFSGLFSKPSRAELYVFPLFSATLFIFSRQVCIVGGMQLAFPFRAPAQLVL